LFGAVAGNIDDPSLTREPAVAEEQVGKSGADEMEVSCIAGPCRPARTAAPPARAGLSITCPGNDDPLLCLAAPFDIRKGDPP